MHRRPSVRGVFIFDDGAEGESGCPGLDVRADITIPGPKMDCCGFSQPDVTVDSRTLVEPTVTKRGIHPDNQGVTRALMHEVADVETEGDIAIVISANKAAVDEHERAAKRAVKFDHDAPAQVAGWNVESAAVPTD